MSHFVTNIDYEICNEMSRNHIEIQSANFTESSPTAPTPTSNTNININMQIVVLYITRVSLFEIHM